MGHRNTLCVYRTHTWELHWPVQEREQTRREGLSWSGGSERPRGGYQTNGGHMERAVAMRAAWDGACLRVCGRVQVPVVVPVGVAAGRGCGAGSSIERGGSTGHRGWIALMAGAPRSTEGGTAGKVGT